MRIGDTVVCVDDNLKFGVLIQDYPNTTLEKNKTYVITDFDLTLTKVELKGKEYIFYRKELFLTLKEYRKLKLKKLNESRRSFGVFRW